MLPTDFAHKEVHRKTGSTLVFCDLAQFLIQYYQVKDISEVEPKSTGDEYIVHCPFCKEAGHTKHKLYIKSDLTVGHCFVCGRGYIGVTDNTEVHVESPDFKSLGPGSTGLKLVKLTDKTWGLDRYEHEFDAYSEAGIDYLIGRHKYLAELWEILDFKFMDDNIVMPFKYKGEVFYYQIRFTGNSKIRYFFPPISAKPPYIIEHGDNKNFIICEGVFDAIACLIMAPGYTPFAVLGSSISDYQLDFLREYVPEKIVVYMDETDISVRLAKKIRGTIDYCPIHIIGSGGTDPEEMLVRKLRYGYPVQWINTDYNGKNLDRQEHR